MPVTAGTDSSGAPLRARMTNGLVLVAALGFAWALKAFYSRADFDDLRWILAPTVTLLHGITGATFELEAHHGYLSRDLAYQVVPSCAGVNFMIVAFVSLACGLVLRQRTTLRKLVTVPLSGVVAYLTTVLANAVRLAIAIPLHRAGASLGPLTPERIHHIEGTIVYFLFLCVIFAAAMHRTGTGDAATE